MSVQYELCEINDGHYLKVLKCNSQSSTTQNTLFVIIPGNPGIIEFYEHFAIELNKKTNSPVIGISHTGHMYHDQVKDWKPANVSSQVNDKVKFIEEHLPNHFEKFHEFKNVIFIGHSIGCYVILEVLDLLSQETKNRVKKSFLFFPTIERMSETPNGKVFTFVSKFFFWFIYFFAYLITFLPNSAQKKLVNFSFTKRHADSEKQMIDNINDIVLKMSTNYSCARSCFHMARDEMGIVKHLNKNVIENNLDMLLLYYGVCDRWCPLDYYHDMKNYLTGHLETKQDDKQITDSLMLDEHGLDHAFVIYKKQCEVLSNLVHRSVSSMF